MMASKIHCVFENIKIVETSDLPTTSFGSFPEFFQKRLRDCIVNHKDELLTFDKMVPKS